MARRVHEDIERELRAGVALLRGGAHIAQVVAHAGESEQPALLRHLSLHFGQRETEGLHHEGHRGGIEVADSVVMRQPRLRAEAQARTDRNTVADAGHGTAAAKVAGDDTKRLRARGDRRRAGLIELAHALRDVGAAEQFGGALGGKLVARTVKTIAAHARIVPRLRHGVTRRGLGHPLIIRGLEECDERHARQLFPKALDAERVGRIVGRRDLLETVEGRDDAVVRAHAARKILPEHGLETHAVEIGGRTGVTARLELGETIVDRLAIVGHALVAAFGQQRRVAGFAKAKEPELERGRAEVGDEDVHARLQVAPASSR